MKNVIEILKNDNELYKEACKIIKEQDTKDINYKLKRLLFLFEKEKKYDIKIFRLKDMIRLIRTIGLIEIRINNNTISNNILEIDKNCEFISEKIMDMYVDNWFNYGKESNFKHIVIDLTSSYSDCLESVIMRNWDEYYE